MPLSSCLARLLLRAGILILDPRNGSGSPLNGTRLRTSPFIESLLQSGSRRVLSHLSALSMPILSFSCVSPGEEPASKVIVAAAAKAISLSVCAIAHTPVFAFSPNAMRARLFHGWPINKW
jgi:hypothetical protein